MREPRLGLRRTAAAAMRWFRIYRWDFGDGVTQEGGEVNHAYTEPGEYKVHLTATGLGGLSAEDDFQLRISGHMPTTFDPQSIKRYQPAR